MSPETGATIDAYIEVLPEERRAIAQEIREIVRQVEPRTSESLRYGMPAFRFGNGVVLHLGFWKHHLGLYPVYAGAPDFEMAIGRYRSGKDGVRFRLSEPVPMALVRMIVQEMSLRPGV